MTLTIKNAALMFAVCTGLSACDALQITGGPLEIGAAQADNLLHHGGFERGFGNWRACSDPQLVKLESNDTNTESSAVLGAGGCLYQVVSAKANDNMVVNCSASKATNNWASITFGYLDANYQPLKTVEAAIPDTSVNNVSATLQAPVDTAYAEVLVYAEDGAEIDDCVLLNTQGATSELLINNAFEEDLAGWQACSHGTVSAADAVATITDSCLSQKFTASEGLQLELSCDGYKTGSEHAAVALGFLDSSYQGIALSETPISTAADLMPTVTLTAPATTAFVEAMVYTQGQVDLNNCSLRRPAAE